MSVLDVKVVLYVTHVLDLMTTNTLLSLDRPSSFLLLQLAFF